MIKWKSLGIGEIKVGGLVLIQKYHIPMYFTKKLGPVYKVTVKNQHNTAYGRESQISELRKVFLC